MKCENFNVKKIVQKDTLPLFFYSDSEQLKSYGLGELVLLTGLNSFKGKVGCVSCFNFQNDGHKHLGFAYRLPSKLSFLEVQQHLADAYRWVKKNNFQSVGFVLDAFSPSFSSFLIGKAFAEAVNLAAYRYDHQAILNGNDSRGTETLFDCCFFSGNIGEFEQGFESGLIVSSAVYKARDMANHPSNLLQPRHVIDFAKRIFVNTAVDVHVIDEDEAKDLGMGAFLGVGQGSDQASYMLRLSYNLNVDDAPIALIGKGVTFDSGGISIKPSKNMEEMKADMTGAATVIASVYAAQKMQLKQPVIALIPLVENMPSGKAQKPGDVVTAMNGKRIEIINTDAEGRLVMADALCYAQRFSPKYMIDIATLTGSCVVALGTLASGLFSNDAALTEALLGLETKSCERLWHLPLYDDFQEDLKSDVADLLNCSQSRYGGASTAAKFLENFVQGPWAHLDIAPTMSSAVAKGVRNKGMTGEGVRTLIALLQQESSVG